MAKIIDTWQIKKQKIMKKLIKYYIHVHYHEKHLFDEKKTSSSNSKTIHCCFFFFFFLMIALKTHRDLIGKFKWIGKMTFKFKAWLTPCLFPQKSM